MNKETACSHAGQSGCDHNCASCAHGAPQQPEGCTHDCSSCAHAQNGQCSHSQPQSLLEPGNALSHVKNVIAVVSGKGGVGKSIVTSSLAVMMQRKGYKVGIMDADITGPSIPKVFGMGERAVGNDLGIHPCTTKKGIHIMSVNLLLEHEDDPVIWRGPVIAGVVKQFWNDVVWGDLDYLFIDMPPGTGDVPLTVFQSLPVNGIVIVTSPQDLVSMIVKKAYNMAKLMDIPVIGLVENMSYVECPDCGKKFYVFGEGKTEKAAQETGLPVLANMPLNPALASLCDEGKIEDMNVNYLDNAVAALESFKK